MGDAKRLFLATGVLRRALMNGGWIPLVVRLVVDLDFTAWQLLAMGVAIESGVLLGEIPTGVVADTFSRKWSVVVGTFILGGAQFASGLMEVFPAFLVTQFIWGIGWTFISGAEIAWVTDETGSAEEVEPLLLRRGRFQFVATFVGIAVFSGLGHFWSLAGAVLVAGSIGIIWSMVLAVTMREAGYTPAPGRRVDVARATLVEGATTTWRVQGLRILGAVMVLGGMAAEAIDRTNVRRLADIGLSDTVSAIGLFGAVQAAEAVLAAVVLWRFEGRFAGRNVSRGFATILILSAVALAAFAHVPLLIPAMALLVMHGGLLDITEPLIATWTNAMAPTAARATVHSFIGQMRSIGEMLGGTVLGAVAAIFTLPTTLTIAAGLFCIAAATANRAKVTAPAVLP